MNIEIGKTYRIWAATKKSVLDIEYWSDGDDRTLQVETLWRNGEYYVTPTDEDEVEMMVDAIENGEEFWVTSMSDYEMDNTFDGISTDVYFNQGNYTDEEKAEIEENVFDLEEFGYFPTDGETVIYNGIEAVEELPLWKQKLED